MVSTKKFRLFLGLAGRQRKLAADRGDFRQVCGSRGRVGLNIKKNLPTQTYRKAEHV